MLATPDAELFRRYAESRSEEAFGELVRRHRNLVYCAALRRTNDPQVAEDISQSVFAELSRRAGPLVRHATLTGWLYTTTRFSATTAISIYQREMARFK